MIELYYWSTPNGHKISIALEELGLDYQVKFIDIGKGEQFAPDFLEIAPNNRMPAIIDHDGPNGTPVSIFESGAILLYLAEKTGQLMPQDRRGQIAVHEWLMWQMGGFGPMLGQAHHFNFYAPEKIQYAMDRYSNEANRLYGVLERRLEKSAFVATDALTIADIAILPWSISYKRQKVDISAYPHVKAWREKLLDRPAFQKGLTLGKDRREDLRGIKPDEFKKLFGQT